MNNQSLTKHQARELQKLKVQAQKQFQLGIEGLPPQDHHLLEEQEATLTLDFANLDHWLALITTARASKLRTRARVANQQRQQSRLMSAWLETAKPQPPEL